MDPASENTNNGLLYDLLSRAYADDSSELGHADFEVKAIKSFCRMLRNCDPEFGRDIKDETGKLKPVDKWEAAKICSALNGVIARHDKTSHIFAQAAQTEMYRRNPGCLLKKKRRQQFSEYVFAPVPEPDASKAMANELKDVLANPPIYIYGELEKLY